ncbi:MAG TPA: nitroreductase family protein [bacterium]|jgi:nitroreductase|nr:nitroreductase family protein [bacterium]HNW16567.1 nitroreductase family protein [bacterium]HNZ53717.1 nitroreductase family protein [bacterium]HOB70576.1 nitroreductase family protein [bacterium]HOG44625.1 nitroreductase family protein [bacterium]
MKKIVFLFLIVTVMTTLSGGEKMNETMKTIFARKSVRNYNESTIPKETFELLVKAGMAAPTARDKRPWEFIIITDKAVLKKLSDALPYAKMAEKAGHGIVVAGDMEKQNGGVNSPYWIMDCSAAVQNILLAAESLGLGAVWTAVYPNADRIEPVSKILGLPKNIVPLAFIPVGTPTGTDKPKDKFNKDQIHWNKWKGTK